jgi:hypothetical protein
MKLAGSEKETPPERNRIVIAQGDVQPNILCKADAVMQLEKTAEAN